MTTITQSRTEEKGSLWGVTLLISGACIGGGMLVMPVQAASAGFFVSTIALLICWAFMTFTGLLLVEATLWLKNETHFSSLSRILIGHGAKIVAILVYLFMNSASLVAYTAGGASLIDLAFQSLTGISLGYTTSCAIFTLLFGSVVYVGARFVGTINSFLMGTLVLAYLGLIGFAIGNVDPQNLAFRPTWKEGAGIFSMILATYSYQMVVPSICSYLNYDPKKLKKAIIWGTSIPCVVYILWILVIHGSIPLEGAHGLKEALASGAAATGPLGARFKNSSLTFLSNSFAFCAVVTSYLGLSLALFSFLKDGLKDLKIELGNNAILFWTFVPAFFLAISYPKALLDFLDLSGGYGDTILSGILPVLMVWMGRYRKGYSGEYRVFGGKGALILTGLFFSSILILQIFKG